MIAWLRSLFAPRNRPRSLATSNAAGELRSRPRRPSWLAGTRKPSAQIGGRAMSNPEPEEAFRDLVCDAVLTIAFLAAIGFVVALVLCPSAFCIAR